MPLVQYVQSVQEKMISCKEEGEERPLPVSQWETVAQKRVFFKGTVRVQISESTCEDKDIFTRL